jgi:uncharacterized protein YjbI with pentapeptide repeats
MANAEQLAKLDKSTRDEWNEWRASQSVVLDLSGANLHGKELISRNLRAADLRAADLSSAILGDANLKHANLGGADLRGATFNETNLSEASLREANLQVVDLSVAQRGLQTEQLAGADLTGATLPPELTKLYDSLENVNNISESARKLFLAVLAACLYSWLTIATTTDVNLITNRASSPLPIIQTSIPIVGFYWVAPLLLLCVYFYFHFYLQKLWEELGSLPAIFPDGRPLHSKIDPWLLNDLVRAHLPRLNVDRPFLSYLQLWISVLLAWWVVPITMFLFWGRYLPRHERTGSTFHVGLLAVSVMAAFCLYRLAVATLRGAERKPFSWKGMLTSRAGYRAAGFGVAVGVLFGFASWGARWGVPSNAPIFGIPLRLQRSEEQRKWQDTGPLTWVPRLMALVGYSPFANLTGAEVSQKKSTWTKSDKSLESVTGAQLKGASLRYAAASEAFLGGAHLQDADLTGADLTGAHLYRAYLYRARLEGADLNDADLTDALLPGSHLRGARLGHADLSGADLINADLRDAYLGDADLRGAYLGGARLSGDDLSRADLTGAKLDGTDLRGADLTYADLTHSDLRQSENLDPETVKGADYWEKAFYDAAALKVLGLPPNHNVKLAEQQKKEQELQQKQNAAQAAPKPAALKPN